ncbi:MAG: asparagine synthase-related protein [Methanomassiliicoccales archaeon]|nr:asparagine synthase-related protein [Methanomassiliicoccales archaeon]MDD1755590.1 asparagine synthase-related protein [Methanomassiliicoccales archaeon]
MPDAERLLIALERAIEEACNEAQVGILFSGGLDSTVLARLASVRCQVHLYTIGMPMSHDLEVARETAGELGLEWDSITLDREQIMRDLPVLSAILGLDSPLVLSFEMPLFVVARKANEHLLISGQGADELFAGYSRYAKMGEEELKASLQEDLERLLANGSGMERRLASRFGKVVRHPYLHQEVVQLARSMPTSEFIHQGQRKKVLRDVASLLDLGQVASRPKKAAQYGSGVMKEMKAEAKRRKVPLAGLVDSLRQGEIS